VVIVGGDDPLTGSFGSAFFGIGFALIWRRGEHIAHFNITLFLLITCPNQLSGRLGFFLAILPTLRNAPPDISTFLGDQGKNEFTAGTAIDTILSGHVFDLKKSALLNQRTLSLG